MMLNDQLKMLFMKKWFVAMLFVGMVVPDYAQLVYQENGKLKYARYANEGQTSKVNTVPDFSFAGYGGGGEALPEVPVKVTIDALPGDNRALLQEAIDKVSQMQPDAKGFRGAVLLKAGVYGVEGSIYIRKDGVVLRGEGNGTNGTVIIATQKAKHDLIIIQGDGSGYGEEPGTRTRIVSPYVPVGTRTFEVSGGHPFRKGDRIVIQEIPNERWVTDLNMAQYGWTPEEYRMLYERTITAVKRNTITIDIPVMDAIEEQYGTAEVFRSNITGRISRCGVENMRIESVFASDNDEEHAWNAVELQRAANCWVKDVVAKYFGYACVNLSEMSVFNTVQDCAMIDPKSVTTGGRKYSFLIEHNSACNLVQRCVSWGGRHDYVTGSRVPGPNVFLDCLAENTFADIGPHHRWATGLLFDNVYGGQIRVQNRKAMGSGHGWAGAQTLFWNCYSIKSDIKVESPVGALNWGIGNIGALQQGSGYWESWGAHVEPRSLYLQQLRERLGAKAVKRVTSGDQRKGAIWEQLKNRAAQIVAEGRIVH